MRLRFLKSGGDEFEVVDDVDVLWALGLALAALETFAGLTMAFGHQVIIEFAVALLLGELLHGVVEAEVLGDAPSNVRVCRFRHDREQTSKL